MFPRHRWKRVKCEKLLIILLMLIKQRYLLFQLPSNKNKNWDMKHRSRLEHLLNLLWDTDEGGWVGRGLEWGGTWGRVSKNNLNSYSEVEGRSLIFTLVLSFLDAETPVFWVAIETGCTACPFTLASDLPPFCVPCKELLRAPDAFWRISCEN